MAITNLADIPRIMADAFNSRQIDKALELFTDQTEWVDVPSQTRFRGKDGFRKFESNWLLAFPDGRVEITSFVASGDRVVLEYTGRGTHLGPLETMTGQIRPTGKPVELLLCDVIQVRDGKIVSGHTYYDSGTLMRTLTEREIPEAA